MAFPGGGVMKLLYTATILALLVVGSGIIASGSSAEQNPDANCDNVVTVGDIGVVVAWFGQAPPAKAACSGSTGGGGPISTYDVVGNLPADIGSGLFASLAFCDLGDVVSGGGDFLIVPGSYRESYPFFFTDPVESVFVVVSDDPTWNFQAVAACIDNGTAHIQGVVQSQAVDERRLEAFRRARELRYRRLSLADRL